MHLCQIILQYIEFQVPGARQPQRTFDYWPFSVWLMSHGKLLVDA
jgi:hypothetical protein